VSLGVGPAYFDNANVRYQIDPAGTSSDCALVSPFALDVTVSTTGTCAVTIVINATNLYEATSLSTSTTFVKNAESATWLAETSSNVPTGGYYTITAPAVFSGGSQFTYSIIDPGTSGCELSPVSPLTLSVTGAGTCLIRAESEGSDLWTSATVDLTIIFNANSQAITWAPTLGGQSYPGEGYYLDTFATTTSGGAVTYSIVGGTGDCSLEFSDDIIINYARS
jgi:hypothetical protein